MLLSEYIAQLQRIQAEEGDLPVINDTERACGCGCNVDGGPHPEAPELQVRDPECWWRLQIRHVVVC